MQQQNTSFSATISLAVNITTIIYVDSGRSSITINLNCVAVVVQV